MRVIIHCRISFSARFYSSTESFVVALIAVVVITLPPELVSVFSPKAVFVQNVYNERIGRSVCCWGIAALAFFAFWLCVCFVAHVHFLLVEGYFFCAHSEISTFSPLGSAMVFNVEVKSTPLSQVLSVHYSIA